MYDDSGELVDLATGLFGSPESMEMAVRAAGALELTDALWELVPVVAAAGEQHDRLSATEIADATASGRRLDDDVKSRIRDLARGWEAHAASAFDAHLLDGSAVASLSLAEVMADPFGVVASIVDLPSLAADVMPGLIGAPLASFDELRYYFSYLGAVRRSSRTPLLLRALFLAGAGMLEPLVMRMVQLLLQRADPQTYPSLTDTQLEKKVRSMCFGPPQKWREALVDTLGVTKLNDAIDWDRLDLLWHNRNAIVHRGAVVDQRHSSISGVEAGTVLNITPADVRTALDTVGAARYAIVAAAWDHLQPGAGARLAGESWPVLTESLQSSRWRQAEGLARLQEAFADDPEAIADAMVYRWLALDRGLGPAAIREEVEAWDVAALPARFALARHILLHRDDQGLQLLGDLVADGAITQTELAVWPLFDRFRDEQLLSGFDHTTGGTGHEHAMP